ncbi:hypothetical protein [Streptomyces lydicus]|uniref:hypothetical protein n=1 Tax=Streptomyces lydicus TaxID=47763 RepID=UPI00101383CE|nr:hypothetical protein [Streptomyces lydicus]MCZ1012247.1 hypothetical protein [Streptomyces lydicus]
MTKAHRTPSAHTPGRVSVALYIATGDPDAAELLADSCSQYATTREWDAVATVTDVDRTAPLAGRQGWLDVLSLLSDRTVRGVVTYCPGMVAARSGEFDAVRELLRQQGAFLATARTRSNGTPPGRSPDQTVPQQTIAVQAGSAEPGGGPPAGLYLPAGDGGGTLSVPLRPHSG